MGYVYATINKDTLAHICKEKGVSSEFLASKTKLNMSRLNQWLTPTDINLPTINQAKKIAACLHILVFLPVHFYGYSLRGLDFRRKRRSFFSPVFSPKSRKALQHKDFSVLKLREIRIFHTCSCRKRREKAAKYSESVQSERF